jgi:hypothetical protein
VVLSGCARTFSSDNSALFLEIELTFDGAINLNESIILIPFSVLGSSIEPGPGDVSAGGDGNFFIFPAKDMNDEELGKINKTVNDFYADYFSTWTSFLYIQGNKVDFINSQTTSFNPTVTTNFTYQETINFEYNLSVVNNKLTLRIDINQLKYQEGDTLFYSIYVFEKDANSESGFYKDSILLTDSFDLVKNNRDVDGTSADDAVADGYDIKSWVLRLF